MNAVPQYIRGNITRKELIEYCCVLVEDGMKYIDEGLKQGTTFLSEILELKEKYDSYTEEARGLRVIYQ